MTEKTRTDEMVLPYQNPSSCNKCAGQNILDKYPFDDIGETGTECKACGFTDYWTQGAFDSNELGFNEAVRYGEPVFVIKFVTATRGEEA